MKNLLVTATFCVLSMLSIAQVPAYVPTNGLVGWWPFNGNANDLSGNGNNGSVNGAVLTPDRFGSLNSAYSFNGTNQRIIVPDANSLSFTNASFTLSYWVNIQTLLTNGSATICKYGVTNNFEYGNFIYSNNSIAFSTYNLSGTCGVNGSGLTNSLPYQNSWHHFVSVHNGSNGASLYVDGFLITSSTTSTTSCSMGNGSGSLYFGSGGGWNQQLYFKGLLDDFGIWNRALSPCEVQALFEGSSATTSVNAGIDQTICAGTSVSLSGTGATTYSWNNGVANNVSFTPTTTATYSVSGTSSAGCVSSDQVLVTVNALPTVDAGIDQTLCAGVSASLTASGAASYSWDNGVSNGVSFTPASSATYSVSGTDANGCVNSDVVIVTVNDLPNVSAGADQSICKGAAVTLSGTGASTYAWNNNVTDGVAFNPISTATYNVSGTDANGCVNADEVLVTVNEASASTLTESALDSYTLNGQTYTQSGTYTQVITNAAGCDSTITLNLTLSFTGLDELSHSIRVYPNPASEELTIESSSALKGEFILFDAAGRNVLEGGLTGTMTRITLDGIASGFYSIQLNNESLPLTIIKQ
jgi:hypothetical protein